MTRTPRAGTARRRRRSRFERRTGERSCNCSEAEDLCLLLREFLVGQDALLVQLAELGESRRVVGRDPGGRRRGRRGLWCRSHRLLTFLVGLLLLVLLRPLAVLAVRVRSAANRSCSQKWTASKKWHLDR